MLCSRCYLKPVPPGATACDACQEQWRLDLLHWDCAIDFAFSQKWIPRLDSVFSLAVPDPLDRFRIFELVLFKRSEDFWLDVGVVGGSYDAEGFHRFEDVIHSPWPMGEYSELQFPIQTQLVLSLSEQQIRDYFLEVRSSQSDNVLYFAKTCRRPVGHSPINELERATEVTIVPRIDSWAKSNESKR